MDRRAVNFFKSLSSINVHAASAGRPAPATRNKHFRAETKDSFLEKRRDCVFGVSLNFSSMTLRFSGVEAVEDFQYSKALRFLEVEMERRGMKEDRRRR